MEEQDLEKIVFKIIGENPGDQWTETIWAKPSGPQEYIIQSSPFQAYGVSYLDKVRTEKEFDGLPLFKEVTEKSGNSTYRLIVLDTISNPKFQLFWKPIADLGCTFENANPKLISVNIPSETDIHEVYKLFQNGEKFGLWDFEEADFAHPALGT